MSCHCIVQREAISVERINNKKKDKTANISEYQLALISSESRQLKIYFEDEETCRKWHAIILDKQGFLDNRLGQYRAISKIGEGSFGIVNLCQHKLSSIKSAVKCIQKTKIEEVFTANGQIFEELDIMYELAR